VLGSGNCLLWIVGYILRFIGSSLFPFGPAAREDFEDGRFESLSYATSVRYLQY
jgi:hypothetical protein